MRNLNLWSKFLILNFWSSQYWRLLRPCTKWRGQKMKSMAFHQYSWNSKVLETTWISLIGWHHSTSSTYRPLFSHDSLGTAAAWWLVYIISIRRTNWSPSLEPLWTKNREYTLQNNHFDFILPVAERKLIQPHQNGY